MTVTKKAGYEGLLYYGAAGSTASTQVTNSADINYAYSTVTADVTTRGDGSAPPIKQSIAVARQLDDLSWTMIEKSGDTTLAALKAAAAAGTPVALRTKAHGSGTGLDADCYVSCKQGMPLGDKQTWDFKAELAENGRTPDFNA